MNSKLILRARGQARHHFWGEYHQTAVLVFDDIESAKLALPVLVAGLTLVNGTSWKSNDSRSLAVFASGDDVQKVEEQLVSFSARREAIGSLKYGVDFGEVFEVAISIDDPKQLGLF